MGKSNPPADPMAAAKARWAKSPAVEDEWYTFEEFQKVLEDGAVSLWEYVDKINKDPLFKLEPHSESIEDEPPETTEAAGNHEADPPSTIELFTSRLYDPDVDLYGMSVAMDFIVAIVLVLEVQLEEPAIRGAKSKLGSKKGGRGKKRGAEMTAANRRDEVIMALKALGLRNSKLSWRNIAGRISKQIGEPAETVRNDLRILKKNKRN